MKKLFSFFLILSSLSFAADVKISQLPLLAPASIGSTDSFPLVNVATNQTVRLKLSDLLSIPSLQSPTFSGNVTAASFIGSGTSITGINAGNITSGTLSALRLPLPTTISLGGVRAFTPVTSNWLRGIGTDGIPVASQPAFSDLSGTLTAAQLPNPGASTLGGVRSYAAVSNEFLTSISTLGQPVSAQPAFSNLSGSASISQGGTGQTTKAAAFDALSPMSAGGDLIYGGASGTGTRLPNGTAGQVLTSQGTTLAPQWATPAAAPVLLAVQTFTGNGTYTKATNNPRVIRVTVVGGGGGGAGAVTTTAGQISVGGPGSGGGWATKTILASGLGASETVTVGAAGTTGAGANGGNGGTTSFGTSILVQATGGTGGTASTAVAGTGLRVGIPNAPGIGTLGDVNGSGGVGSTSWAKADVAACIGGNGGGSLLGGGGTGGTATSGSQAGSAATGFGGGGGGGVNGTTGNSAVSGGAATAGVVIVEEFS